MRAIGLNVNGTNGINEYAQRITADRMWWGDRYWEPGSFKKALTCLLIMHWNDTSDTLIHLILYLILCRYCVWHSKIQSETQLVRKTDIFNTKKTDCSDPTSYGFMKFSSERKKWDLGVGSYGEVLTPHRNVFHYFTTTPNSEIQFLAAGFFLVIFRVVLIVSSSLYPYCSII